MGTIMIEDLFIIPLKQITDERGAVLHFLKCDSPKFKKFGEAYFSKINEGIVKGWKLHKIAEQNFCVPFGAVKIVVFDDRINSSTRGTVQEILLNDNDNYKLLSLPAGVWYSFKSISKQFSLLANIVNIIHSPEEAISLPINTKVIPYEW